MNSWIFAGCCYKLTNLVHHHSILDHEEEWALAEFLFLPWIDAEVRRLRHGFVLQLFFSAAIADQRIEDWLHELCEGDKNNQQLLCSSRFDLPSFNKKINRRIVLPLILVGSNLSIVQCNQPQATEQTSRACTHSLGKFNSSTDGRCNLIFLDLLD